MIDNFSLGLTHALMLLVAWRLWSRPDLDTEKPLDEEATGWRWGMPRKGKGPSKDA
jgi:hypothetical protein